MNVIQGRGLGLSVTKQAARALASALGSRLPADLARLCVTFADAEDACFPDNWANPMFDFWLALVRVRALALDTLAKAQGLATLRAKTGTTWSEPVIWTLQGGISPSFLG